MGAVPSSVSDLDAEVDESKSALESVEHLPETRASESVSVWSSDPSEFFEFEETDVSYLGQGGFGEMFKAIDKSDGAAVVVKKSHICRDVSHLESLFSETEVLQKLKSPHIVQFRAAHLWKDRVYLFTEYCARGSLRDVLNTTKKGLPETETLNAMKQCVEALVYLHSMKVLHRDIKAANILVDSKGVFKLADFGVTIAWSTLRVNFFGVDTPGFVAPEIRESTDAYTEAADIYSLGKTCIELAECIYPSRDYVPKLPGDWGASFYLPFVAKCCVADPRKRPSAVELREDACLSGEEVASASD